MKSKQKILLLICFILAIFGIISVFMWSTTPLRIEYKSAEITVRDPGTYTENYTHIQGTKVDYYIVCRNYQGTHGECYSNPPMNIGNCGVGMAQSEDDARFTVQQTWCPVSWKI